jgi:hypothetical protein
VGASQDAKTWSVDRFTETVNALSRRIPEVRILLVGVASETEATRALMAACPGVQFEDLVAKTQVDELAAVLERSDLLLTSDTGTMHLAAAVGTTTCAVFVGLGMPHETAVYAEGHWVLMSSIACAPCSFQVTCGHPVCHDDIPTEWVADLLQRILEGAGVEDLPVLPRATLMRTCFDEDGLLDLIPVHVRRPDPQELLAMVYRAVFLESFEGIPLEAERIWKRASERYGISASKWTHFFPATLAGQLARLDGLGQRAEQLSSQIEHLSGRSDALAQAAKALNETDAAIYTITRSEPLLAPLGLSLEGALEDLPEVDLPTLASLCNRHYQALRHRARALRRIIGMETHLPPSKQGGFK